MTCGIGNGSRTGVLYKAARGQRGRFRSPTVEFASGTAPPNQPFRALACNLQALNDRWNELRSALQLLLSDRGKDIAGVPGGRSGLLCREFRGKTDRRNRTMSIPA